MYDKKTLCEKIHELYPELGVCDQDLEVAWDSDAAAWTVNFEKDGFRIKHYLEDEDTAACMENDSGRQTTRHFLGLVFPGLIASQIHSLREAATCLSRR